MSESLDFFAFAGRVKLQRVRTCGLGKRALDQIALIELEAAVMLRDALDDAIAIAARQRADEDRRMIEILEERKSGAQERLQIAAAVATRFASDSSPR